MCNAPWLISRPDIANALLIIIQPKTKFSFFCSLSLLLSIFLGAKIVKICAITVSCKLWNSAMQHVQGGPKKWGHYVWRLRSLHTHIFKMPKQISVIFGLLQCRYILNTSVDSIFIKFIIHIWAFWRCGHAKIWAFKRSGLTFLDHPVYSPN